jgi:hypothetical protein
MSKKIIVFYFLFMFLSIGLFSIESGVTGIDKKKEVIKPKKPFKHNYKYSNLC